MHPLCIVALVFSMLLLAVGITMIVAYRVCNDSTERCDVIEFRRKIGIALAVVGGVGSIFVVVYRLYDNKCVCVNKRYGAMAFSDKLKHVLGIKDPYRDYTGDRGYKAAQKKADRRMERLAKERDATFKENGYLNFADALDESNYRFPWKPWVMKYADYSPDPEIRQRELRDEFKNAHKIVREEALGESFRR